MREPGSGRSAPFAPGAPYSAEIRTLFSATERVIRSTANTSNTMTTAGPQNTSKGASADACSHRKFVSDCKTSRFATDRVVSLTQQRSGSFVKEETCRLVEWIEPLAKPQVVILVAALLHRLGQRDPTLPRSLGKRFNRPSAARRKGSRMSSRFA